MVAPPQYHKLSREMCEDIRFFAEGKIYTGAIIEVLQNKYPDKYIYSRNVYNMVQNIRYKNGATSDSRSMNLELINQKQENPSFHIDTYFEVG